ncbi:hypothetical protein [Mesorhizobium australicum]|nr:hypothetical protein [Mesorhizobium australicum]
MSLVIDGEVSGARRAVRETKDDIVDLGKTAEETNKKLAPGSTIDWGPKAADSLKKIKDDAPGAADALADVGEASRDAKPEIDAVGSAAAGAAPKFSNLKTLAAGALAGFATGLGAAAIAAGLSAAAGAAGELAAEILSNTPMIERDLKSHEQLVRNIKGAYAEAEGAASSYGKNSTSLLRFQAQQDITRLERDLEAALADAQRGALHPAADPHGGTRASGAAYDLIAQFRQELQEGKADVIEFRNELGKIGESLPAGDSQRGLIEQIVGQTETAAQLQSELERARDLLQGLQGDADAAATALGGSADKYRGLGEASGAAAPPLGEAAGGIRAGGDAAAAANPHLAETERLLRAIAGLPSPARQAVTPVTAGRAFAAGGYTGDGPASEVAGFVHGREFVFDAASTAAIGVGNLEAIRRGVRGYAAGGYVGSTSAGTGASWLGIGWGGLSLDDLEDALQDLRGAAIGLAKALLSGEDPMEALAQAALSLADKLANAALNEFGDYLFGKAGEGLSGIFGNALSWLFGGNVTAGLWHSGGTIGAAPAASRSVPASLFAAAPRLHGGGMIRAGERPAILMEGEEVGWPDQLARKYGGDRGGQTVNNFYVETPTPRAFAESRATVARGASRLVNRLGRYS